MSVSVTDHAVERFASRVLGMSEVSPSFDRYIRFHLSRTVGEALAEFGLPGALAGSAGKWRCVVAFEVLGEMRTAVARVRFDDRPTVATITTR